MSTGSPDPHLFEFELDRAIRDQVIGKLEASPIQALAWDVAPRHSGVYVLYKGNGETDELVYVGKASRETTESERDLRGRLNEHVKKIRGRQNISLNDIKFRFLTIASDWFVWAAERSLITTYNPIWNASGFGNKDYGRGRDKQAPSQFDLQYPIDETFVCAGIASGEPTAYELLEAMKRELPYVFRYQKTGLTDYFRGIRILVDAAGKSAEELFQIVVNALGEDWQGTIFKSHMILYREHYAYDHAIKIVLRERIADVT